MPRNENTTNHEPVIVVPANDYHGQEIMQTPKNGNEILQAVKQEIKNELLQAVRDNNFDITKKKNNARQD
ncbi:17786_t:CDS:2 [Rhizophagus irregularis]|nr:17786_t:CDS:2 [Rhizophagus irregularis]